MSAPELELYPTAFPQPFVRAGFSVSVTQDPRRPERCGGDPLPWRVVVRLSLPGVEVSGLEQRARDAAEGWLIALGFVERAFGRSTP